MMEETNSDCKATDVQPEGNIPKKEVQATMNREMDGEDPAKMSGEEKKGPNPNDNGMDSSHTDCTEAPTMVHYHEKELLAEAVEPAGAAACEVTKTLPPQQTDRQQGWETKKARMIPQSHLATSVLEPTGMGPQGTSSETDAAEPFNPFQEIMPIPTQDINNDAARMIAPKPGAFPARSSLRAAALVSPRPPPEPPVLETTVESSSITNTMDDAGLARAQLVGGHGRPDLPQAQEFDHHKETRGNRETIRRYHCQRNFALTMILFLVAIVVILLVVLVPKTKTKESDSSSKPQFPMETPSLAPTASQESYLLSLLPERTVSAIQEDSQSPQSKAFHWLLGDLSHNPLISESRIRQRFALVTLYFATRGGTWTFKEHWLRHSRHECDWQTREDFAMQKIYSEYYPGFWTEFFPPTEPTPTKCNVDGLYWNLWLDQNDLVGSIPEELYLLTTLQTLSLIHNELHGTLSSHIGRLTDLDGLAISNMRGGGPIPSEIGLLTKLRGINLHDNGHWGAITQEFWHLTNLQTIFISLNSQLSGTIPTTIGLLANLRWIILKDCNLTGTIPTEMGQLGNAEWLTLEANKLTGTLPTELGLLSTGPPLYLMSNELTGPIPSQLGMITTLSYLSLRDNKLTGSIPTQIGLMSSLSLTLDVENQFLSGTIPTQLGLLTDLQELSLSNNLFSGPIPSELGLLSTSLGWLDLSNNTSLEGTIPQELNNLRQSLYTVLLEGNSGLSGTVPAGLCTINGTCVEDLAYRACRESIGLTFDCSEWLCGCECDCSV